jgi:hypothetical protein
VGGVTLLPGQPIQDLTLTPGTDFNPGTTDIELLDVAVSGTTTFDRLPQVGTTIEMENGHFIGTGFHPALGNFTLKTGQPNGFTPMTAVLQNVIQDEDHPGFAAGDPASIISADITYTVPDWGVRLDDLGIELDVRTPFSFTGTIDGLPPSVETIIADPNIGTDLDPQDVYVTASNEVIGYSTNRRYAIAAVPEPSTFAICGVLSLAGIGVARRRKRKAALERRSRAQFPHSSRLGGNAARLDP